MSSPCRPCFLMGSCRPLSTSLQTHQMSLAFGVASGLNVEWVGCGFAGKRLRCTTSKPAAKDVEACENTPSNSNSCMGHHLPVQTDGGSELFGCGHTGKQCGLGSHEKMWQALWMVEVIKMTHMYDVVYYANIFISFSCICYISNPNVFFFFSSTCQLHSEISWSNNKKLFFCFMNANWLFIIHNFMCSCFPFTDFMSLKNNSEGK